jgi:hypothetical protein
MAAAPTYKGPGRGVNLAHALHDALEKAERDDPHYRVGKDYEIVKTTIEAGNSHVHVFKVEIEG